jgi:hypothetical protein
LTELARWVRTDCSGTKLLTRDCTSRRRTTNRVRLTAKIQSKINIPTHCPSGAVDSTMYDLYCEKYKRCRRCIQDPSLYRSYKVHMLFLSPGRTKSRIDIAIVPIKKLDVFMCSNGASGTRGMQSHVRCARSPPMLRSGVYRYSTWHQACR